MKFVQFFQSLSLCESAKAITWSKKSAQSPPSVVCHHPSDISRLKKYVPLSPAMFCNLAPANIVRPDAQGFRKLAVGKKPAKKGRLIIGG